MNEPGPPSPVASAIVRILASVKTPRGGVLLAGVAIVLATLAAYHNTFSVPFVFDGEFAVEGNKTIRRLGTIRQVLSPPAGGATVGGRPLLNLSFAVNYDFGGTKVWGYHAVNLAIHVVAGLTLFGIVRRTLLKPACHERYRTAGRALALAAAMLWAVHPLQTESVTYIVQRAESLMGLFYLLTLYAFIRGTQSGVAGWHALSIGACALGMATKEVMVSAPLIVLLYDRTFVAGTFAEALRRRWRVYAGLFGSWLLLGWLVIQAGELGSHRAGFRAAITWWPYALTQLWAIPHYLWLCVWPHPLVFDYGTMLVTRFSQVAPSALIVVSLATGTLIGLRRWPALGFLGGWFFAILAPTSSVLALAGQTVAEHRMYLPLAAVVMLLVLMIHAVVGRRSGWVFLALAVGLGILTERRNADYRSDLAIWSDTVAKRPDSVRAQSNLGTVLIHEGRVEEAMAQFQKALELRPNYAYAAGGLGYALLSQKRVDEAIAQFQKALEIKPEFAEVRNKLANAFFQKGLLDEAIVHYQAALQFQPGLAEAHNNLGWALLQRSQVSEAILCFQKALELQPDLAGVHNNLGNALLHKGQVNEAIAQYRKAVEIKPDDVLACNNLAWVLATSPEPSARNGTEAITWARQAEQLSGGRDPVIVGTLAAAYAEAGRFPDAVATARRAIELATAQTNLALANGLRVYLESYQAGSPFRDTGLTHAP